MNIPQIRATVTQNFLGDELRLEWDREWGMEWLETTGRPGSFTAARIRDIARRFKHESKGKK